MANRKPSVKIYKSFRTAAKASERLNTLALLHGLNSSYMFLVYGRTKLVKGVNVTTFYVGTKDHKSQTDDLLYVVNGKAGLMPFRLKFGNYCKFKGE